MTGLIHFSQDAASNDVAAPPILFVEGQPAGTVNNSMREVMAAMARWRDDNAGGLVATRGGGDLYSIATSQIFNGGTIGLPHTLAFTVGAANQGPASLSLDGLAAAPIRRLDNVEVGPQDLRPGVVYRVARSGGFYLIISPAFADCAAIGSFASAAVPDGWLPCDGRAVSRVSYAALFARIGTTYGGGDNATTFNIPDTNGSALFGVDSGKGRLTGAGGLAGGLGSRGGSETVELTEAQLASHGHNGSTGSAGGHDHGGATGQSGSHSHGGATGQAGSHTHSGTTEGGGAHTHSGSTDGAGAHAHGVQYLRGATYRTDGGSAAVNALNAGDAAATNTTGITDPNGTHAHSLTITGAPAHQHGFTTSQAEAHTHAIPEDGQHAHGIASVGDHAHSLSISASGGGQAHSNMPPGLVVTFAIKV